MRTRKIYWILLLILVVAGCKKILHDPETLDPVYLDFMAEAEKSKKAVEAKEKEIDANKQKLALSEDVGYEKKLLREDIFRGEKDLYKLKQMAKYYELSAESRQIFVRKEYLELFKKNKEWNPKTSADLYFKNKELQAGSRHWTRGVAAVKPTKKEAPKEGHGGGEEKPATHE